MDSHVPYSLLHWHIKQLGGVHIPKKVYGHNLVRYLLDKKWMDKSKILFVKKSSDCIDKNKLADFIKKLRELFPDDDQFKPLALNFIGQSGKRYSSHDYGFMTDDLDTVFASFYEYNNNNNEWNCKSLDNIHFVRVKDKKRIYGDNSQIFRQIVSQGIIKLLNLIELTYEPGKSTLVGYNTDSVFIENPRKIDIREYPLYRTEEWKPKLFKKRYDESPEIILYSDKDWNVIESENNDVSEQIKNMSCVVVGGGIRLEWFQMCLFAQSGIYNNHPLLYPLPRLFPDNSRSCQGVSKLEFH